MSSTDLVPQAQVGEDNLPVLVTAPEEVLHALNINLGTAQLSMFDFTRLKVPTGGATKWSVETLQGRAEIPVLVGVIAQQRDVRTYWKNPYGQGETRPPDCSSIGGQIGVGDPGGSCPECKYNIWGSKQLPGGGPGRGKACSEGKQMLIYRDNLLPELLQLPPTSLKSARQYLMKLGGQALPYYSVLTAIALEQVKNPAGIAYSEARFRAIRRLTPQEAAQMKQWSELLATYLERLPVDVPADPGGE